MARLKVDLESPKTSPVHRILRARIGSSPQSPHTLQDIFIHDSTISKICDHDPGLLGDTANSETSIDANGRLVTETLCHAHVHLDKAFLFSDEKYADLLPQKGDFEEAMELGKKAKERFERDDLLRRGSWLIAESVAAGVSTMRVFVEVDHIVQTKCLDAAIELKAAFRKVCDIQICVFAQNPIFSGQYADQDRALWEAAAVHPEVDAVGSTPYVEDSPAHQKQNYELAIRKCKALQKHLDLHLDYNLDASRPVMTYDCFGYLRDVWPSDGGLTVSLGHCTRLTLLSSAEMSSLQQRIAKADTTPIHFIGLPTSDLFIQGRPPEGAGGGERPRGTLQIPHLIDSYGFDAALSINNVGNSFTPQGSCDPLLLASWCVGTYQCATQMDTLFQCISSRARSAIGESSQKIEGIREGAPASLVIYGSENEQRLSNQRPRLKLADLIFDPPKERQIIVRGNLVEI